MKRSFTTTLILLAVCAGLIAWYAIYEKKIKKTNAELEEKGKQLVALDKDQIQELSLKWMKNPPDKENSPAPAADPKNPADWVTVKLQKTGNDWNIVEPIKDAADNSAVNSMVTTLVTSKYERIVEDKAKDLTTYSLVTPILTVTLKKDSAAKPEVVDFGRTTPVGFSVYAKNNPGDTVYRMQKSVRTALEKDAKALRNKNILNAARPEVSEIELQLPKERITLTKDAKENWLLASENVPADGTEVGNLLGAILDLKATDFVSEDGQNAASFGLANPLAKISLKKKDNGKIALAVGKAKDKIYVKRDDRPNIYEVDKGFADKLTKPGASYRNKELANFNRFDVKRIKLERAKNPLELLKEDAGWTLPVEHNLKLDSAKVDGLLTKLQDTKIVKYLTPAAAKVKAPQLTVRIFEKKDQAEVEKVVLRFGPSNGKEVTVEREGLAMPFQIKDEDFKKLMVTKDDLTPKAEEKTDVKKEAEKKS